MVTALKYLTTPQWLFDVLDEEFNFTLDPCCTRDNIKCPMGFPEDEGFNGLEEDWHKANVFMNPPYDNDLGKWTKKAYEENKKGALIVAFLPAYTDTDWFQDYVYRKAELRFIEKGLVTNEGIELEYPLMIVIWKPETRLA